MSEEEIESTVVIISSYADHPHLISVEGMRVGQRVCLPTPGCVLGALPGVLVKCASESTVL